MPKCEIVNGNDEKVRICDEQEMCELEPIVAQSNPETTKKKSEEMSPDKVMTEGVIVSENDDKLRICEMTQKMCESDSIVALHSQVLLPNLENLKKELILSEKRIEEINLKLRE